MVPSGTGNFDGSGEEMVYPSSNVGNNTDEAEDALSTSTNN
jgi:hypothetical protein